MITAGIMALALTSLLLSASHTVRQAPQNNPAVQRAEMIQVLRSIDTRLTSIQAILERAHPKSQESK